MYSYTQDSCIAKSETSISEHEDLVDCIVSDRNSRLIASGTILETLISSAPCENEL